MIYRVIGLMSGSSLDGLDIAYVQFDETGGKWSFDIQHSACYSYSNEWKHQLQSAFDLHAKDYLVLHSAYGQWLGEQVNKFIEANDLQYKVQLIASHGHTVFHSPAQRITGQLGDGSAIAATCNVNVVSDLRSMDVALGGQGAPLVPIGEKLLFPEFNLFLNLGGIANISSNNAGRFTAFDICPANRVLNMLAQKQGLEFDPQGSIAATGSVDQQLLQSLNSLDYYRAAPPKSLANEFGSAIVFDLIENAACSNEDALRTYTEHIAMQVSNAVTMLPDSLPMPEKRMMVTGGGALNNFVVGRIKEALQSHGIEIIIPDPTVLNYKEALVMALVGILRWRDEVNCMSSVTGASRDSSGGTIWSG